MIFYFGVKWGFILLVWVFGFLVVFEIDDKVGMIFLC